MSGTEMVKVACENCGANIDLDGASVAIKRKLKKKIECAICRNARVSRDHDVLEQIFYGNYEEEPDTLEARRRPGPGEVASFF